MNDKTVVIERASTKIQCIPHEGKTMFKVSDFVGACGIKAPTRWLSHYLHDNGVPDGAERLHYITITKAGKRNFQAWFAPREVCESFMDITPVSEETREWLTNTVLTYQVPERKAAIGHKPIQKQKEPESNAPDHEAPAKLTGPIGVPVNYGLRHDPIEINRRIDAILIELIQLKNELTTPIGV